MNEYWEYRPGRLYVGWWTGLGRWLKRKIGSEVFRWEEVQPMKPGPIIPKPMPEGIAGDDILMGNEESMTFDYEMVPNGPPIWRWVYDGVAWPWGWKWANEPDRSPGTVVARIRRNG